MKKDFFMDGDVTIDRSVYLMDNYKDDLFDRVLLKVIF